MNDFMQKAIIIAVLSPFILIGFCGGAVLASLMVGHQLFGDLIKGVRAND